MNKIAAIAVSGVYLVAVFGSLFYECRKLFLWYKWKRSDKKRYKKIN